MNNIVTFKHILILHYLYHFEELEINTFTIEEDKLIVDRVTFTRFKLRRSYFIIVPFPRYWNLTKLSLTLIVDC